MKKIITLSILFTLSVSLLFAVPVTVTNPSVKLSLKTSEAIVKSENFGVTDNVASIEKNDPVAVTEFEFSGLSLTRPMYVWWRVTNGASTNYKVNLKSDYQGLTKSGDTAKVDYSVTYESAENTGCTVSELDKSNIVTNPAGIDFTVTNDTVSCFGYIPLNISITQDAINGAEFGEYSDTITVTVTEGN